MPAADGRETRAGWPNDGTDRQTTVVVELAWWYNSVPGRGRAVARAAAPVVPLSLGRGSVPEQALDEGSLAGMLQIVGQHAD